MYHRRLVATLFALMVAATSAWAGGVYLYEKSATDAGLGSAGWTARADDASTIFSNPAGLARLKGSRLDITIAPPFLVAEFAPDRNLTTNSGTDGDASGLVPLGGAFYSLQLSDVVTFGVGLGGYFGLAAEYEKSWVGRYYVTDVQLQALTIEPAAAFRVSDHWSLGVGIASHYGIFNQTAAINNTPVWLPGTPAPDGELKVHSTDWTFQGNLGVLYERDGRVRVGLQYLTPAKLEFRDVPQFTGLRPLLQAFLQAAGVLGTRIDLGMEMPQAIRAGFHMGLGSTWNLMGDVGWEQWSRFGKIDVLLANDNSPQLTADRNYQDVWHVAAGVQHDLTDDWRLNFGAAYDSSMVESRDRTPDLAVGQNLRLGVGAEYRYAEEGSFAFAYELAWSGNLPMAVNRGQLAGSVVGEYEGVAIHFFAATWRKRF